MQPRELDRSEHPELKKENPQTQQYRVEMIWDAETNNFQLKAGGIPTIVLFGMMQMGLSAVTREQVVGQVMATLVRMSAENDKKIQVVPAGALPKEEKVL